MQNQFNEFEMLSNLSNWKTLTQIANNHPQFTRSQLKVLFWKRDQHDGLSKCVKKLGSKLYVNEPAFSLWMSGVTHENGQGENP